MEISFYFLTEMKFNFPATTSMICLEKQDCVALARNGIPVYQNVKVSVFSGESSLLNVIIKFGIHYIIPYNLKLRNVTRPERLHRFPSRLGSNESSIRKLCFIIDSSLPREGYHSYS